jgi:hypothetical protein
MVPAASCQTACIFVLCTGVQLITLETWHITTSECDALLLLYKSWQLSNAKSSPKKRRQGEGPSHFSPLYIGTEVLVAHRQTVKDSTRHIHSLPIGKQEALLVFFDETGSPPSLVSQWWTRQRTSQEKSSRGGIGRTLKEQKSRLYIIRRCVAMLLFHRDLITDRRILFSSESISDLFWFLGPEYRIAFFLWLCVYFL